MRDSTVLALLLLVTLGTATDVLNVTLTQITCSTVNVSWTSPNNTAANTSIFYNSTFHSGEADYKEDASTPNTTLLMGLLPSTRYGITVITEHNGRTISGFKSVTTAPRSAGHVLATADSIHSILLSHNLNESGVYYVCNATTVKGGQRSEVNKNVTKKVMNATGLLPDTTYRVDCVAYHSDGVEYCLEANTTVTTRPDRVLNVTVRGSTVHSVHSNDSITVIQNITWEAPPNHHSIRHYVIKYQMQGQATSSKSMRTSNNATEATLALLVPRGKTSTYSVWVAAVSQAGQGEFSDRVNFTYSRPGVPNSVQVQAQSCHTLKVTWQPPRDTGGLTNNGYNISYTDMTANIVKYEYYNNAKISLQQLNPGTRYTVKVKAINAIGGGEFTKDNRGNTNQRRKGTVSITATSAQSTQLSHNLAQSGVYYMCNVTELKSGMKDVNTNVTTQLTTVTGLLPDTTYRVDCVAYHSDRVEYCLEANTTVTTRPDRVLNVTVRGSTVHSVHSNDRITIIQSITWEAPPNHHSIQHYVVKYQMQGQATSSKSMRTSNNVTQATLVLLVLRGKTSAYSVWVAAVSEAGQGEFNDRVDVMYSKPDKPTGVSAQAHSCHMLKVMWQPPTDTGGLPITGYNVTYKDTISTTVKGSVTEQMTLIQHLSPGTAYKVAVHAVNAIGRSGAAETRISTDPRGEGYVNVRANSAHSIHIQHNLTESGVYYVCNVTTVEGGVKKEVNTNVTTQLTTVTGLLPDTTYRVDCVAYHRDGVEYCLEANTTVTTRLDRVGNVTVRGSTVHSVHSNYSITIIQNITWEAPPNHHSIRHYVVKYQMQGQATSSVTMRTSNNGTQATLLLLVPRGKTSTYSVWVAAVSEAGQGEFSDRVDFKYSRPDPPTQVQSANPTCNSINITWSAPRYTGGVPLVNYTVRWSGRGSPQMTVGPDVTAVTVTRLSPNTSYTVKVRAVNAIGKRSEHLNVTTAPQDKSLMVSVSTISSTSLHITAQPPPGLQTAEVNCTLIAKENNGYIRTVSLNSTRGGRVVQRLVDSLAPYTTYTATCLVFKDGVDQCYIGSDTTQTYTDIPSGPPERVVTVSTSSHSFTMKWDPPPKEQQNGEILSYEVEYREEDSSTVVNDTTQGMRYTAEDLTTDRVYQFRVAATTVNGTGPFSEWSEVATIPTVTNLRAVNTTTNSTTITWDQPPHNYRVFLHGEATDNIPQSRVIHLVDVTGQTTHNIGGLDSFRNYSIGVYLESGLGQGSNATVTFQTRGRAPGGRPTNLTATPTSRSVTLQWSPPPVLSRNGILTHYEVVLANETWNITQSHSVTGQQRKRREAVSEGVGEKTQSLTVKHLNPFTNYTWEVAAVSDFGSGPTSDRRKFETHQDVPTQVENIKVNPGQKTITWAVPAEPNGIIVGYRVQYWELGRRDTAEDVNTTAEELVFSYSNFAAGVPHKVQVQAATVAGLGESRVVEEVLFSEEQAPAVSVSDITVTRVNGTAVNITWTALTLNEARGFPSYVVTATNEGEQVSSQRTTSTSVVVGGLMPHTEYNITVQALTAGGDKEGPLSAPVTLEKTPFVQPEFTNKQSATVAAIGVFVGGTVFGILATLLVVGIVLGAVGMKRRETVRKKQSLRVKTSTGPADDAIPMAANPSYEAVHVYEHIDQKDSKQ